jgi:hypothetical protein
MKKKILLAISTSLVVLAILNFEKTKTTVLVSDLNPFTPTYDEIHQNLLSANTLISQGNTISNDLEFWSSILNSHKRVPSSGNLDIDFANTDILFDIVHQFRKPTDTSIINNDLAVLLAVHGHTLSFTIPDLMHYYKKQMPFLNLKMYENCLEILSTYLDATFLYADSEKSFSTMFEAINEFAPNFSAVLSKSYRSLVKRHLAELKKKVPENKHGYLEKLKKRF